MEVLNRQIIKGKPFFNVFSYKSAKYHEVHVFSKTYTERCCVYVSHRLCHRHQPRKVVFGRHQKLLTVTFFFQRFTGSLSFISFPASVKYFPRSKALLPCVFVLFNYVASCATGMKDHCILMSCFTKSL